MRTGPVIIAVTVTQPYQNEEEDEQEEQSPGGPVHDGGGQGDGDRVHHSGLSSSAPLNVDLELFQIHFFYSKQILGTNYRVRGRGGGAGVVVRLTED